MKLYLGTDRESWLDWLDLPLMVSRSTLWDRRKLPTAYREWIYDSSGFTQIAKYGKWTFTARDHVRETRRLRDMVGNMEWAAIQDWMCEPEMVWKTKLSVAEHIKRTVDSYLELNCIGPDVNWLPIIQGYTMKEYQSCIELYDKVGVSLARCDIVGIGSICKRQHTAEIFEIVKQIAQQGIRLHTFGMKTMGLKACKHLLISSDSQAWSFEANHSEPLPGCNHKNCKHCPRYACHWYDKVLREIEL